MNPIWELKRSFLLQAIKSNCNGLFMKSTGFEKFCPRCGRAVEKVFSGLCFDCFFEKNFGKNFPQKIVVEKCNRCEKLRFKGNWLEQSDKMLFGILESQKFLKDFGLKLLDVSFEGIDEKNLLANAVFSGNIGDKIFQFEKPIEFFFQPMICDPCMRTTSYYHEGIVQVRFESKFSKKDEHDVLKKTSVVMGSLHKADSLAKIVDTIGQKTGVDFLIGSRKAAKILAESLSRQFNSEVKTSYTLVGVDSSGKQKKRHTYCIRIKN